MAQKGTTFPRVLMTASGALVAGLYSAFFSHNWGFSVLAAALLGALVGGLSERLWNARWAISRRPRLLVRLALVIVASLLIAFYFRLDKAAAFETAFGVKPPPGLRDLRIEKHYGGGPGDVVMLIRFTADQKTLQGILKTGGFQEDADLVGYTLPQEWPQVWQRVFSNFGVIFGGKEWESVPPIADPKIYIRKNMGPVESTRLLWNPVTGQAYALYTLG